MSTPKAQTGATSAAAGTSNQGNVLGGAPATSTASVTLDASTAPAAPPQTGATSPSPSTTAVQGSDEVAKKAAELVQTVAAAATQTTSAGSTTKVKMLRNHPRVGAFVDTVTELPTKLAEELVAEKYATKVSDDGSEVNPYGEPTAEQLAAASAAYGRFLAAGKHLGDLEEFMSPSFSEMPADMQRCLVAAIDPAYGPQA